MITTVQWNIGGGKILKIGSDPTLMASYSVDGLTDIIHFLKDTQADIITLQEVHKNSSLNQADYIAKELGLGFVVSDFYADSHVEEGQELGQAIISRYPIADHSFKLFLNPEYQVTWEDGSIATSHDKGVTKVRIEVDGRSLQVVTTHLIPFKRFEVDLGSNNAKAVLDDIQNKLRTDGPSIIQGDFNLNFKSLQPVLPKLFESDMREILQTEPTTPQNSKYDHILYRDVVVTSSSTNNKVYTDHYPIVNKIKF